MHLNKFYFSFSQENIFENKKNSNKTKIRQISRQSYLSIKNLAQSPQPVDQN
jgi:hypothetical protein